MLAADIVQPSESRWASGTMILTKSDYTYRFCVDYRKLNKVSIPDTYHLPFVSAILDKLRCALYLTTLDIKSVYWQIPIAKGSQPSDFPQLRRPSRDLLTA